MSLLRRRILLSDEVEQMERWELIQDITINETKQNITTKNDLNGLPFKLKKVEVFIISKPTEYTTGNNSISVCLSGIRDNSVMGIGYASLQTDEKRYCYGLWEKISNFGFINISRAFSINGTSAFKSMQTTNNSLFSCDDNGPIFHNDTCESIWIGSHYQAVLSPGTNIKIYGVRDE